MDFGGFIRKMVEFLVNDGNSAEIRNAAAKEITRHLAIPSEFLMAVVKQKWNRINSETKQAIKTEV